MASTTASGVEARGAARTWSPTEDWLSVAIGLLVVALALAGVWGQDLLGWVVSASNGWTDPAKALGVLPAARAAYGWIGGLGALAATYIALLVVLTIAAAALGANVGRFVLAFTVVFALSYGSWIIGNNAHIAAVTPKQLHDFGVDWSLKLTNEGGFIVALLIGILIANFLPGFADWLKEAVRPELFIKIAIVILGATLAVGIAGQTSFLWKVVLRGFAAIVEAYLIYWAVVYFIARKWFGFSREWAAPLASGISICGVAAAVATGGAIRARPQVPVLVSSLVVVFAVFEVLVLPVLAATWLWNDPLVAAAWNALAIKTDGAAVAGGSITEALILAKNEAVGIHYKPGLIVGTTAAIKIFIDVFIGIWAFVLAYIWTNHINRAESGERATVGEIWQRFPKFIIGFVVAFAVVLYLATSPQAGLARLTPAIGGEANTFRVIFFVLTFFSIGVLTNFRKLWEEGIAKLALVYIVSLAGFVIWVGLLISWLFFHGVTPPLAA